MAVKNSLQHYGIVSKLLHLIVLILIIGLMTLGHVMGYFENPLRLDLYTIHKSFGLLTLFVGVIFILWTLQNVKPAYPSSFHTWEQIGARSGRYALYFVMIAMPVCGWCLSTAAGKTPSFFGLFYLPAPVPIDPSWAKFFSTAHKTIGWIIIVLVILHTCGALKHHFMDKDNVLTRMFKFKD